MIDEKAIVIKGLNKEYYKKISLKSKFLEKLNPKANTESFFALKDINLEINKGEIIGIIGPNGSGKSTLLKILAEVTPPTSGEIEINGKVASILEIGIGFQPDLSGYENIFLSGRLYGLSKKQIKSKLEEIIEMFGFPDFINTAVKYYSSGMYMRLAFAIITNVEADIYLFDEILSVGDLGFRDKVLNIIEKMAQHGKTILIVTHTPNTIFTYCNKIILLSKGETVKFDKPGLCISKYNQITHSKTTKNNTQNQLENKKILINENENIKITKIEIHNVNNYFQNEAIIISLEIEKLSKTNNIGISIILKDELNKPIAQLKSKELPTESGKYRINYEIPCEVLNTFKYLIDIFIWENHKPSALYQKAGEIILNNENIDESFCLINLKNFEHQIIKLHDD